MHNVQVLSRCTHCDEDRFEMHNVQVLTVMKEEKQHYHSLRALGSGWPYIPKAVCGQPNVERKKERKEGIKRKKGKKEKKERKNERKRVNHHVIHNTDLSDVPRLGKSSSLKGIFQTLLEMMPNEVTPLWGATK